jgi:ABC-type polysaccharide/polyol phosphate export permease
MGSQAKSITKKPQVAAEQYYDSAARRNRMVDEVRELVRYRDLVRNLVRRNVTARYKRSVLGVLWTLLDPLLLMIVMAVVFGTLLAKSTPSYPVFLLSGIVIWNFFSQSSTQTMMDFVYSGSLVVQVYMPKSVFAVSSIGTHLVNLILAFIPLVTIVLIIGHPITPALLFLPVSVLLIAMFTLGTGLLVSALAVFFADMINIFNLSIQLLFFISGVFFSVEVLPEGLQRVIFLLPTYQMVTIFRYPIYEGLIPPIDSLIYFSAWAVGTLVLGLYVFTRLSDEYAYRV